ncbi:MAG TPA: hypothetical protein VF721_02235 [Pyrinomonadaceae bacterium]|jgi:hypothetical protein
MKIKASSVLFWLCLYLFASSAVAQTQEKRKPLYEWERIVPLVTKKAEVEDYFGKPYLESKNGYVSFYKSGFGRITVYYYGATDLEKAAYKCNVSRDTVSSYDITLAERIPLSSLVWNLNQFERTPGDDGRWIYDNLMTGVSFSVESPDEKTEEVVEISYEPSARQREQLCQKNQK